MKLGMSFIKKKKGKSESKKKKKGRSSKALIKSYFANSKKDASKLKGLQSKSSRRDDDLYDDLFD